MIPLFLEKQAAQTVSNLNAVRHTLPFFETNRDFIRRHLRQYNPESRSYTMQRAPRPASYKPLRLNPTNKLDLKVQRFSDKISPSP